MSNALYSLLIMSKQSSKTVSEFFNSGEVQKLSGLSKHMVDYLCRHGLLTATLSSARGYGKGRRFSFADVLLARSISRFLSSGVSVLSMKKSMKTLGWLLERKSNTLFADKRIAIVAGAPYLCEPNCAPISLIASGQMAFSFVLDVEDIRKRANLLRTRRESESKLRTQRANRMKRERIA